MSRLDRAMSPAALLISILALVISTSFTAWAAATIGTADLKDGAVTSPKIKNGTVRTIDLSKGAKKSLRVRAYATVDSDSGPGATPEFLPGTVVRGFTAVSTYATGAYCLTLDPALGITDTSKLSVLVSAEYGFSAGDQLESYYQTESCPDGQIGILTEQAGAPSDSVAFTVLVP